MKKKANNAVRSVAAVCGIIACFPVMADSCVYVGTGETLVYDVPADAVFESDLVIAPRGKFVKTGKGRLTIPTAKIAQGWKADIVLREGALEICRSSASDRTVAVPVPDAMRKAMIWFDSSDEGSLVKNGADGVTVWTDARETGNAETGYSFVRSVTDNSITEKCPELKTKDETTGLYFHGYPSGCWMNFLNPDGTQAEIASRNVFAVQGHFEKFAPIFGCRQKWAGNLAFVPAASSGKFKPMWANSAQQIQSMYAARTYIDGFEVDAFTDREQNFPSDRFALLEVEFTVLPGSFQCLFNDRDYWASSSVDGFSSYAGNDRVGGEYLCELVAFTNSLTSSERLMVERYLMAKWFGVQRPERISVTTSRGTVFGMSSASDDPEDIVVEVLGAGDVEAGAETSGVLTGQAGGFSGRMTVEDGPLTVKCSAPYPVLSGESADVAMHYDGRVVTPGPGTAGAFTKTGDGDLRADAIPADVKRVDVNGGEMVLESPRAVSAETAVFRNAVTGTIPNASFEIGIGETELYRNIPADGYEGWYLAGGTGGDAFINHSAYRGGKNNGSVSSAWALPWSVPDGGSVLVIKQSAVVRTSFSIPEAGVYALEFKGATRMLKNTGGQILEISVGRSESDLVTVGYLRHISFYDRFSAYRYLLPRLEKGEYQLWFRPLDPSVDKATVLDDFSLTLVPDDMLYEIPNGSFEKFKAEYSYVPDPERFQSSNFGALADWEIVQSSETVPSDYAFKNSNTQDSIGSGPVTLQMGARGLSTLRYFYNMRESDDGSVQLYLQNGASASVEFTPVAGSYQVRADIGLIRCTEDFAFGMEVTASVSLGGADPVGLGTVTVDGDFTLRNREFPQVFSVDGKTSVKLTLSCELPDSETLKVGQLVFDNVKLVRATNISADNLLENGGFSEPSDSGTWDGSGWSVRSASSRYSDSSEPYKAQRLSCSGKYNGSYGADWHDGDYAAVIVDDSAVWRDVSFINPGRHRVQLAARRRVGFNSLKGYGPCPLRLWTAKDGVTNEIARFTPVTTNFTMYSWAFDVPEAGERTFGIEGAWSADLYDKDRNMLIDAVSIVYDPVGSSAPDIPEDVEINVAEGAVLRLDYPGVCTAGRVRINGRSRSGIISAKEYPQSISGDGELFVRPKGVVISVR